MDPAFNIVFEIDANESLRRHILSKIFKLDKHDGKTYKFNYRVFVGAYNAENGEIEVYHYDDNYANWIMGVLEWYARKGITEHSGIKSDTKKNRASKINNERIRKLITKLKWVRVSHAKDKEA